MILLVGFNFYVLKGTLVVFNQLSQGQGQKLPFWLTVTLENILPAYFLVMDVIVMFRHPLKYFKNVLFIFRIAPMLSLINLNFELMHYMDTQNEVTPDHRYYKLLSITNLLLWFQFFVLLRSIRYTAHLVQMIIEVFKDIKIFLLILMISIFAFTSSFDAIHQANADGEELGFLDLLLTVSVMTMGEPDMVLIANKDSLAIVVFILTAVFNLIVMLNLLIAIVTETYQRVKLDKNMFLFRLKVEIIAYLMALHTEKTFNKGDPTKLLFFAQDQRTKQRIAKETESKSRSHEDEDAVAKRIDDLINSRFDTLE